MNTDLKSFLNDQKIAQFSALDIDNFKDYTGTYLLAEANLELEIVLEGGTMYLVVPSQDAKSELTQKSETTLMDKTVGATFSIIEGAQDGFSTEITRVVSPSAISGQK
ncbi:MAG: hypothetical protein AB8B59_12860 [Maribacter sp.]